MTLPSHPRRLPPIARLLPTFAAAALALPAAAETQDWSLGRAIDCPLPLSTPSHAATRTIVFPGGAIADVPVFWDAESQLCAKAIRNTLVLQLRDAAFSATLQVFDDKGNLFLIDVHAAHAGDSPDEVLLLRPSTAAATAGAGGCAGSEGGAGADSDAEVTRMMAAMVGGGDPGVVSSLVRRVEDGRLKVGRRIFADDTMSLELVRVFQGPRLRGYQCLLAYHGSHSVRLEQQRLYFPGALAVYASAQVLYEPGSVSVAVQPDQSITLDYVATP
jgi:hypothetical protein